jgi:VanZ family protein
VIEVREEKSEFREPEIKPHGSLWNFIPFPFFGTVLLYCILLFSLSSVSSFPAPSPFAFFDKIVHFFLFAGLSTVIALGLQQAKHQYSSKMLLLIPVSFSVLYGLSDEIHQLAVPLRQFSAGDIAADAVGATFAACFFLLVHQWKKLKR